MLSEGVQRFSDNSLLLMISDLVCTNMHVCIVSVLRVLYQLWSGQYEPLLAEHFKGLEKFHPFERDNVLGM